MNKYFLTMSNGLWKVGREDENGTKWYLGKTKWYTDRKRGYRYRLDAATRKLNECEVKDNE